MKHSGMLIGVVLGSLVLLACLAGSAAALVPDGTHGWFWQMPQPAGGMAGMADVAFPTATDVWSVGDGGLVLHSGNAGATWAVQPTGSDADLWSVSFVDGQNGWACGDAVLATHDGGATWLDKTPAKALGDAFDNASFVDATHGWIATGDGAVLRTTDGGDTWTRLNLPGYKSYVNCDFVDATHGWVIGDGGRLWKTTNGGTSWTRQVGGLGPRDWMGQVAFSDRSHGWLLGYSAREDYDSVVFTTSDGGAHWRRVRGADSWASSIDAAGPRSAWLVSGGYYFFAGGAQVLQHTTDGGRHWQTSTIGAPASPYVIASHGDAVCAVGDGVLVSTDGGSTWRAASSGQTYAFSDVSLVSATDIWAVDQNGALVHSVDGARWAESARPVRWSDALRGVSFLDAQNGWVVGSSDFYGENGVILHTDDGGATWTPQTSNLAGGLVGVDFVDKDTGWAISSDPFPWGLGANTCIERTTDGGATWVPLYVASGAALSAVHFRDASTGWAAGSYQPVENDQVAAIFATTNGGLTWTKGALPKGAPEISDLQFLDADTGWAVGVSYDYRTEQETGWVLRTIDGGKTWTRVPGLDDAVPYAVRFSDAQHGWIGGDNGVYATTDGGTTWDPVAGGSGVTAIAAVDPQHVWAFGSGFLVSTVDASGDTAAPATVDQHLDSSYSSKPVTVHLLASDIGGSGVASTDYSADGGTTWQPGTDITIEAPADHANDGDHAILYRSTDNAGNVEATETRSVGIDTLGPACSAPRKSVVNAGRQGILYFKASDATSGVARATISVLNAKDRVVERFVERRGNWGEDPAPAFYWLRFNCKLKPGAYRIQVRAVDAAGNAQVTVGRNTLRVVTRGAPPQSRPDWPAGLPYDSSGFGARQARGLLGARHGLSPGLPGWPAALRRARELRQG